jgi:hypothetical protein
MFIKLKKPIIVHEYEIQQHVVSYSDRLLYSKVSTPLNDIFSLIPDRYRSDFTLRLMKITGNIPPHTDSGILTTINIYVKPDRCKTSFYKIITDSPETMQIENQTNGEIFSLNSLTKIGEFVAEKDEAWLLDVSIPHSVVSRESTVDRIAVCLQSAKHDMSAVTEMLIETNNI